MVGIDGNGTLQVGNGGAVTTGSLLASQDDLHGDGTINATEGAVLDVDLRFDATHGTQQVIPFGSGGTLIVNAAGGELGAGYKSLGSLTFADGIVVASSSGYIGYHSGSTGLVTITGPGSYWNSSKPIYIGVSGSGTLRVEAGAKVSSVFGHLGSWSGTIGTATIAGFGSQWSTSRALHVGHEGMGTLRVEERGNVTSSNAILGIASGAIGKASITGTGSQWTNSYGLMVSRDGSGILSITHGGLVIAGSTLTRTMHLLSHIGRGPNSS